MATTCKPRPDPQPRFGLMTTLAYGELLRLGVGQFPICHDAGTGTGKGLDGWDFKTPTGDDIIVSSYQEFCRLAGISPESLMSPSLKDGCCVRSIRKGYSLILYNEQNITNRVRFTIMHEVGHLIAGHHRNAKREEIEAHFFASQFLMPGVIIAELSRRGYQMNVYDIRRNFGVSMAAAKKKILQMVSHRETHLDKQLVSRFAPFLNRFYPPRHAPDPRHHLDQIDLIAFLNAEEERLFEM